jgi:hypothetical protein
MHGAVSSDPALLLALLAICVVLLLAGRATVELLTVPGSGAAGSIIGNPTLVAVGACAIPALLLAWALKAIGMLGFSSMMGGLAAIIACAVLLRRSFREIFLHPLRKLDVVSVAYVVSVLAFLFLLRPFEYPVKETPDYLTPGFDLLAGAQPGAAPYFGSVVLQPVLYARHVISALVSLLAYPSHSFFFATGLYLVSALVAPTILLGAYVLFRRFLSGGLALAVTIMFCAIVLHHKTWLLRADSLAWISGFACLIVQSDIQAAVRRDGLRAATAGAAALLILLYLVTFLSDAVVALIVALFASGLAVFHIWGLMQQRASRLLWQSFVLIGFCAVLTLGLGASFARSYSSCAALLHECAQVNRASPVAAPAAATEPERSEAGASHDLLAPMMQPAPPYVWAGKVAQITALLAPAAPFIPNVAYTGLYEFPSLMMGRLETLSPFHILVSTIVFLLCCFLQFSYAGRVSEGERAIFWAAAASYILLILVAIGLDRFSSEVLAIVIARHIFLYAAFFYWVPVFVTLVAFVAIPAGRRLRARVAGIWRKPIETLTLLQLSALLLWLPQRILRDRLRGMRDRLRGMRDRALKPAQAAAGKPVSEVTLRELAVVLLFSPLRWIAAGTSPRVSQRAGMSGWGRVALVCLMPAWFLFSINSTMHRPLSPTWVGQRIGECVNHGCGFDPDALSHAELRSLSAVADFVGANADPGDWVFSNVISESRFGFLTGGRNSLFDGMPTRVPSPEQTASVGRLAEFARFARTADPRYLGKAKINLIVLYKHADCRMLACYGERLVPTDLAAFARRADLTNVLENDDYVIYQRSAAAGPGRPGGSEAEPARRPNGSGISSMTFPEARLPGID